MNITRRLLGVVSVAALTILSFSHATFAGASQQLGADSVIETIKKTWCNKDWVRFICSLVNER